MLLEMCNNLSPISFNHLCYIDFCSAVVSFVVLLINCVCYCFLAKKSSSNIKSVFAKKKTRILYFHIEQKVEKKSFYFFRGKQKEKIFRNK